jgi:uncharacterized protein YlxP (DUF503 family)
MIVGVVTFELYIPGSNSLKIKRSSIKSIKERLRSRFNVSVAELAHNDKWQRSSIGVSIISNDKIHVEKVIEKITDLLYGDRRVEVIDIKKSYF